MGIGKQLLKWGLVSTVLVLLVGLDPTRPYRIPPLRYDPPLPAGGSVFFVGNSMTTWKDLSLPDWIYALGKAEGVPLVTGSDVVPGDLLLGDFLHHPKVLEALASRKYSVWILQAHELEPVDHPAEFRRTILAFHNAITAAGGRTVLFVTWEFPWRHFITEIAEGYEEVGQDIQAPIIPIGQVYRSFETAHPQNFSSFFLTADKERPDGDIHENQYGTAVNTYLTFEILTGRNPYGHLFSAPGNDLDPALLRYLSDRTWAWAVPRLKHLTLAIPSPIPHSKDQF